MAAGAPADFGPWYEENYRRLFAALTVAAADVHVAEDAAAEAFARAYERWGRVRDMESPTGWLYKVALNYVRRRARRAAMEHDLLRRFPPEQVCMTVPLEPELWQAVRALTERQRTAIALRYLVDLPEAGVAEVMGVARGTVSATLATARRRLAAMLAEAPDPVTEPAPKPTHERQSMHRPKPQKIPTRPRLESACSWTT